jgi:hypothetical protein
MSCEGFIALMVDAADGKIAAADRKTLDGHVAGCVACRAAFAELEAASPVVETLRAESASVRAPEGFDGRVRRTVAEIQAARERRGFAWWFPRLAGAAAAAALAAVAIHAAVTWNGRTVEGAGVGEALVSVFTPESAVEPETPDEAEAVAEGMFEKVFADEELAVLEAMLNGDIEEEILEMDEAALKAFEKSLEEARKANKSG